MNVGELVKALLELPQDLPVTTSGEGGEGEVDYIELSNDRFYVAVDVEETRPHVTIVPVV